jgi:integrase
MAYIREKTIGTGERRYQVRWRQDGKHGPIRSLTFHDRARAEKAMHLILAYGHLPEALLRPAAQDTPTLRAAAKAHLEQLVGVTPRTIVDYRRALDRHYPLLMDLPVTSIDREAVVAQIKAWQTAKVASKTISNRHGILSSVLGTAVRRQWITANPCAGIRLPRNTEHEKRDMCFLTPDEYDLLLGFIPPYWQPLIELFADSGARWGEVTALRVRDLDLCTSTISIIRAYKRGEDGRPAIGPTKTRRSWRAVRLTPATLALLTPLTKGRDLDDLLLVESNGARIRSGEFWQKVWTPARLKAKAVLDVDGEPILTKTPPDPRPAPLLRIMARRRRRRHGRHPAPPRARVDQDHHRPLQPPHARRRDRRRRSTHRRPQAPAEDQDPGRQLNRCRRPPVALTSSVLRTMRSDGQDPAGNRRDLAIAPSVDERLDAHH